LEDEVAQGGSDADSESEETEEEFDVEEVTGHRGFGTGLEYKVKWAGCEKQTWESAANLTNAQECIRDYEQRGRATDRSCGPKTRSARSVLKAGTDEKDDQLVRKAVCSAACCL